MYRSPALILLALALGFSAPAKNFSGAEAFAFTRDAVALGPRPDGSPAIAKLRATIRQQLAMRGCEIISDRFTAQTPDGPLAMENIIAKFPGKSGRAIATSPGTTTTKQAGELHVRCGTMAVLPPACCWNSPWRCRGARESMTFTSIFFDGEEANS